MIFSNFVGGAAIFSYNNGDMELIRVNKKYIETISMNLSEKDFVDTDPANFFAPGEIDVFVETIKKAIVSHDEEICDTWRTFTSRCCGKEDICIRTSMRLIGNAESEYIFYAIIQLEGIIPLTKQRIPFVVKYTTEFDDNGRPVKAYGSATAVAQNLENAD